ncbi:MAG TPA: CHAD domain-containing protein [Gaiellaceae bacterium]|nr:CHAD domain-containing protein [Gaiellaceae bacterium]
MNGHDGHSVRVRAYELSLAPEAGTPEENWLRAERELAVAHEYDTIDRDLEQLGMRVSRLPSEAGVVWRLSLPRGETVEAWEPGTGGLAPPDEIARLIDSAAGGKPLVPAPPLSDDPGAQRLREMIATQRRELLAHDPGVRLGDDPENLHEHRVAARRIRAYLRASRRYLDPAWRRSLGGLLAELGDATGPVRDLDVLLELLRDELARFDGADRAAGEPLLASVEGRRDAARERLLETLRGEGYRVVLARLRLPPRMADDAGAVPLERIARKVLDDLVRAVDRLGKHPDEEELHRLRIALKRTRYAVELAAPAGEAGRRFVEDAKALQALLGDYQDAVVAEQRLRELALGDARTAASFVAGRLVERQQARRARIAKQLPAAWKRLRKSGTRLG